MADEPTRSNPVNSELEEALNRVLHAMATPLRSRIAASPAEVLRLFTEALEKELNR